MKTMTITIAPWIYEKAQAQADKYRFTLLWWHGFLYTDTDVYVPFNEKALLSLSDDEEVTQVYKLMGTITRETEKAVLLECKYWNLNRAGRYVTDAPVCDGFKVWIPKSAIYAIKPAGMKDEEEMIYG